MNPCAQLVVISFGSAVVESSMVPQILKIELPYNPAILSLGICLTEGNTNLKRYVHTHVHWIIIYTSQDMEKIYVSTDG